MEGDGKLGMKNRIIAASTKLSFNRKSLDFCGYLTSENVKVVVRFIHFDMLSSACIKCFKCL